MNPRSISDLFTEEPYQWGLRGDPHLWRAMHEHFEETPLPPTGEELMALIASAFAMLTGHPISEPDPFFVERYSHGGMSSGYVDPRFWRKKVLPLLQARYAER
jgi:molybdenum cofactor cytidylyltransferase